MDRQTSEAIQDDEHTNRQLDNQVRYKMPEQIVEQRGGQMNEHIYKQNRTRRKVDRQTNKQDESTDGWTRWMKECTDGQMDEWTNRWMNRDTDGQASGQPYNQTDYTP